MKKSLVFLFALLFFAITASAQVRFGLKAGISTDRLDKETVEANGLSLAIKDAKYGYHFGVFARGKLGENVFIQPEILFNSNSVDFTVNDMGDGFVNTVLNERYQNLDIPVLVGLKFGPLRVQGGPVGHIHIASKSELGQIDGFEEKFNNFKLGYQAGIGLDIWKLLFDFRYEGNLTRFGEHISVAGEELKFSQNPSRFVMSVGFSF